MQCRAHKCHPLVMVPTFKTARSDPVPCYLRLLQPCSLCGQYRQILAVQTSGPSAQLVIRASEIPPGLQTCMDMHPCPTQRQTLKFGAPRQLPPLCIYSALAESPVALAGWGPGPCLWGHRLGVGLTYPRGQSGRDAVRIRICFPLSWCSAAGKHFSVCLRCNQHTLVSCAGSLLSQRVQEQRGLVSTQLTVQCRYFGKRHTHEQKVLSRAVLPHRTDPAAKQTSQPTNAPQP